MRKECTENRWAYGKPLPISRLLSRMALKLQIPTQRYGRRPFGVGMLVAGYDEQGPHIYYLCPSANAYDCKCFAIGSRSQSARTYLERHVTELPITSLNELITHGLKALHSTLPNEIEITSKAYVTSTQVSSWLFTSEYLATRRQECNLEARKRLLLSAHDKKADQDEDVDTGDDPEVHEGLSPEDELMIVQRYVYLMKALFDKFTSPALPIDS
ncbi:unnamed protein product [Protopolystoma xenopodis]|uniref:Proteasome alpha-type subunits domain-containing protein n=1 Tax=Protopolystoma xenopodis TaxID=117903 RepID=A0A448WQX9_9PLAT|nr:unnamed protein product [Protopolystoma xenopodis]